MNDASDMRTGKESFFKKPYSLTTFFALGILLFLLPFVQIKCGSQTLAENSGLGIAIGSQWKISPTLGSNEFMKKMNESVKESSSKMKEQPDIILIVALAAGIAGIIVSIARSRFRHLLAMSAGLLAVIMMLAFLIKFKMELNSQLYDKEDKDDLGMSSIIKIQFTMWYFLSLLFFAAAAYFGFRQHRDELKERLKSAYDFEFERRE